MPAGEPEAGKPPIIQYWDSAEPPSYVADLVASFPQRNPDLPHSLFDERRAAALIEERFGERELAAFRACAVPAMQADYFRYCAVHALGGVYVDADFLCRASLRPLLSGPNSGTLFGRPELPAHWRVPAFEWRERVGPYRVIMNSFFAFPRPGHPLPALAVEIATANIEQRVAEDVALVTGPAIFTSLYLLRELGSFDAYVEYAAGGVLTPFSRFLCETIGDHARVLRALDGVALSPELDSRAFVGAAEAPLPYKETEDHWVNATASIYR